MVFTINNQAFCSNDNEFIPIKHQEYNNLKLYSDVRDLERIVSLLNEFPFIDNKFKNLCILQCGYGGFVPIQCSTNFEQVNLINTDYKQVENIKKNIENQNKNQKQNLYQNICFSDSFNTNIDLNIDLNIDSYLYSIIYTHDISIENINELQNLTNHILVVKITNHLSFSKLIESKIYESFYELANSDYIICVPAQFIEMFNTYFSFCINDTNKYSLNYDNLINMCIMVKNAGPQFEEMLIQNLPIVDRWTILDTGSTDETLDIINRVLIGKKKGTLYQEPFINFRDSRNRLLQLAGESCKYNIMLDDTYVVQGDLRAFLTEIRSDQYASSFTLMIQSDDTKYGSNRIIRSDSGLKYIYKIHEVISDKDNINVVIPDKVACIIDKRFDYMEKRTMERKQLDLKLLYEEVEDDPMNARTYYYLGQTYNLLSDYENAYKYYLKRAEFTNSGFIQERIDAVFEAARIANFKLMLPWTTCEELYLKAYKIDETRPESLYFIGIHYYLKNDFEKAFENFKKGFEIGYPQHCQYSLKPTLSFHFLPKFLTRLCYIMEDYKLGEAASAFFLLNNKENVDDYQEILSWHNIFKKLNIYNGPKTVKTSVTPFFCFVADGGFNKWSGSTILTSGVGGSETYIIEMARWIQKSGQFQTIVFCNCQEEEVFENTIYKPLIEYYEFVNTHYIQHCIVSRFSEYLPLSFKGWTENVYLVVHDLTPSGIVIPMDKKLKNVFCLSEWHVSYFTNIFPMLKDITVPFYYGNSFLQETTQISKLKEIKEITQSNKVPLSFIYSSFPNRGLLQLLEMWPIIYSWNSSVSLHIYSDVNNKWSNDVEPEKMKQIKNLLKDYSQREKGFNIYNFGWVKKSVLRKAWETADIWFYPCTFMETFCLTALEAASSKTFVVTNDLAALQNTVGSRGLIVKGDPTTNEWKQHALKLLFHYLSPEHKESKQEFIERNYEWSLNLTWENQSQKLLSEFILPNNIEYKGMYNWTHDLPQGHKQYYLDVLQHFKNNNPRYLNREKINILEIGTYTGISLIHLIKEISNSYGIGVDMWTNYNENNMLKNIDDNGLNVESSFYKNIGLFGLEERIKGMKMDSTKALFQFIKEGKVFDFIYVDGSHLLLDCYSDLVLSWVILGKGGIIGVDDYTYKQKDILKSPFEAINHFLKRYEGQYKLLHKGYRVFLEKL